MLIVRAPLGCTARNNCAIEQLQSTYLPISACLPTYAPHLPHPSSLPWSSRLTRAPPVTPVSGTLRLGQAPPNISKVVALSSDWFSQWQSGGKTDTKRVSRKADDCRSEQFDDGSLTVFKQIPRVCSLREIARWTFSKMKQRDPRDSENEFVSRLFITCNLFYLFTFFI